VYSDSFFVVYDTVSLVVCMVPCSFACLLDLCPLSCCPFALCSIQTTLLVACTIAYLQLPVFLSCLYVCLSVCLSIVVSIYLSVCLSVCLSVRLSVCLFLSLSVSLSVCLSVCLSVRLSVSLFGCLFVSLSVCLSVCLSVVVIVSPSICGSLLFGLLAGRNLLPAPAREISEHKCEYLYWNCNIVPEPYLGSDPLAVWGRVRGMGSRWFIAYSPRASEQKLGNVEEKFNILTYPHRPSVFPRQPSGLKCIHFKWGFNIRQSSSANARQPTIPS
jgi:hypothetical protein